MISRWPAAAATSKRVSEEPSTPGPDAASPAPGDDAQAPSLEDSLRRLESAGREGLENAVGTLRALRMLVAADLALAWARSAARWRGSRWPSCSAPRRGCC
jgi:hypothetical protein